MQPYLMPLLAATISFLMVLSLGRPAIAWLRSRSCEPIKTDSATLHRLQQGKSQTPSMGGLFLLAGLIVAILATTDWSDDRTWAAVVTLIGFGAVGWFDDLLKTRGTRKGLSPRGKLVGQLIVAGIVGTWLWLGDRSRGIEPQVAIPFWRTIELGAWSVAWTAFVLLASANAVNLADGLDGLASGMAAIAAGAWLIIACVGTSTLGTTNAGVLAAATLGASLGFLWFNRHPASVFMGDTGSLPLGAMLGLIAILLGHEILWLAIGGMFVVEAASVIVQVAWYKRTGRRVFRCAPLHHHYQFVGWPEATVVRRFWLAAALCAVFGLACWML